MTAQILPENILRCMSPADRASLGKGGRTADECRSAACDRAEKDLQKDIRQYLGMLGLWSDYDAPHKRRTGTVGAPDFIFPYRGHFVAWEVKVGRNNLDPDQVRARDAIVKQGGEWRLVRSLFDCQAHLREIDGP